jgi:hypothetical protein
MSEIEVEVEGVRVVRPLRAPWAAGVAGLLFAILFTVALGLLRSMPIVSESDDEIAAWFASGQDTPALIGGLFLAPFAGVAVLWFIAVVRDQVGEREDRFFATVFFGSGVLFVGLLFVAAGIASSIFVGPRYLDLPPPTAETVALTRTLSYSVMFAFATRAAALFILATATVGRLTGAFPGWFSLLGYVSGLVLLLTVSFFDWIVLILPAWVAIVSLFILRRERSRLRAARA